MPAVIAANDLWVTARDGVEVPVSHGLSSANMFRKAGHNPVLVYGYGSYGASMDPAISAPAV